jgi:hypothetical protein
LFWFFVNQNPCCQDGAWENAMKIAQFLEIIQGKAVIRDSGASQHELAWKQMAGFGDNIFIKGWLDAARNFLKR